MATVGMLRTVGRSGNLFGPCADQYAVARWLGWFGFLAALMCAVAVFAWASSGLLSPGMAIFPAYLAVSAYLLANAILMVRMK